MNAGLAGRIGDLVGKLEFSEEDIKNTQKSLDANGISMPNFKNVGNAVAGEPDAPSEPVESDQERLDRLLTHYTDDIIQLQSFARGSILRRQIAEELKTLYGIEDDVTRLQSQARGFLVRKQYYENADTYREINNWTIQLQTYSRAYLLRRFSASRYSSLDSNQRDILMIQAVSRGKLARDKISLELEAIRQTSRQDAITALQAFARGLLSRKRRKELKHNLTKCQRDIILCQAHSTGYLIRRILANTRIRIDAQQPAITSFQAECRATLMRRCHRETQLALRNASKLYTTMQALARGLLMRRKFEAFRALLELESDCVTDLQAPCSGALARIQYRSKCAALAGIEWAIVQLQAASRGALKRRTYKGNLQHYKKNMERVVKVQSFVRARQQGAAYKSLTIGKDPPISTIKNFLHLLNDSNFDFEEEVAMEQVRKHIVQSVRQNEAAEDHIEQMDIKIALFVKQAIKIDEVIQHQRKMDKGLTMSTNDSNPFDLRAMNKQARRQLENYQKFFYILQTQPVYLARLFTRMQVSDVNEKQLKSLETFVMVLYGYAQKKREEYYLLRLIRASIIKEISHCTGLEPFMAHSYFWSRILLNYVKGVKETKCLRDILSPFVDRVVGDDFLDLESDPMIIFQSITEDEEMRTGQPSNRSRDITQEYAIQDPDTRVTFIKHLRDLRDLTEAFILLLESCLAKVPFGIRYIARESYRAMAEHLDEESPRGLIHLVGHLVYSRYIHAAVVAPDQYGVIEGNLSPLHRRNLAEIGKMLSQISSGKLFEEGSYLQPLNEFIAKSIIRMGALFEKIIQVPDAEDFYNVTELDDVIATKKPILYIKAVDIFAIHSLVFQELSLLAPERDDPLHEVVQYLGAPPVRAEDMTIMSISNSEIALTLDPKAIDVDDPEADERALFMQTKRYLLYIIRVQSGSSLIEILVQPVTEEDEYRWLDILREERTGPSSRLSSAYNDTGYLDISQMSYADLKRECLENIVKLEQLGWISRENQYQELLNRIADDIRTQNRRRIERQFELKSAQSTLSELTNKRRYLDGQLKSYNDYIEQAMMSLQSKRMRKKSILPFTKQYFHMRDLQKSGKVPKFGSKKYSASKLYDKGVLLSISKERAPFDKIDLAISSDRIGAFSIESSYAGTPVPGGPVIVLLDDLLQAQYNKIESIDVFDGQIKLQVSALLNLLFKNFFSQ